MRSDAFLKENFPLVVRSGATPVPVDWFHGVGIARVAAQFVVKVFPVIDTLNAPSTLREPKWYDKGPQYAHAWTGLHVQIVEHGVGQIDEDRFAFDDYLTETTPGDMSFSEYPSGICVISWICPDHVTGREPPYWKNKRPTAIGTELLVPMQRYIAGWL